MATIGTMIRYIQEVLPERDKLEQLSEECSELGKAALKLIRAKQLSANPTPVSIPVAEGNLKEEALDVIACLLVCGFNVNDLLDEVSTDNAKWARWVTRIQRAKEKAAAEEINDASIEYLDGNGHIMFVRQDLSGQYRIFQRPVEVGANKTFRAHVCRIKAFGVYGTFVEAQLALDVEAQRRSWPDYAGD